MSILDAATMRALQVTFLEESFEGLDRTETGLLALHGAPSDEVIGELFRAIHSIKGGAGAFAIDEITELAHVMENLLDDVRGGMAVSSEMTQALLEGVDGLRRALLERQAGRHMPATAHAPTCARLAAARGGARVSPSPENAQTDAAAEPWRIEFAPHVQLMRAGNDPLRMLRQLDQLGATVLAVDTSHVPPLALLDPTHMYLRWTLRVPGTVSRAALDDVFSWVEGECELAITRERAMPAAPAAPTRTAAPTPGAIGTLRVGVDKIDQLMNMVGELVITQSMLGELDSDAPLGAERMSRLREGLALLARNTRALQESVVRLRSMPIGVVFGRLPRMVHDLGQRLGKEIELAIEGETTELDKTVVEKIGDPLVHIVRNSIDHGLETPAERQRAGKPPVGTIRLRAEHRGSAVMVEVSDDGRGLDLPRILAKAKERGMIPDDAVLRDEEIAQLIFAPGFSTAKEVSDISGRGVGMDVVWRHIKELRGEVSVESRPGEGTRVRLSLPLTLAIVDGQLLRLGEATCVIPLLAILESVEIDRAQRRKLGLGEVIRIRDQIVPVIDLAAALGLGAETAPESNLLVVVEGEGTRLGLLVDELLGQQQVVIKSLETNFGRVDGLAGATIMGDGRIAYILDIVALARRVRRPARTAA